MPEEEEEQYLEMEMVGRRVRILHQVKVNGDLDGEATHRSSFR